MKEETKIVNGRMITHKDVIHHTTTTTFKFWDRVKILIGKRVFIHSEIYTQNDECNVIASQAATSVERIFKPRRKMLVSFQNSENAATI